MFCFSILFDRIVFVFVSFRLVPLFFVFLCFFVVFPCICILFYVARCLFSFISVYFVLILLHFCLFVRFALLDCFFVLSWWSLLLRGHNISILVKVTM